MLSITNRNLCNIT